MKFYKLLTALLSTQVPASVTENCEMEPNYGSHEYFRKQHEERLRGKVRLGYHGDTEEESKVDINVVPCARCGSATETSCCCPWTPSRRRWGLIY